MAAKWRNIKRQNRQHSRPRLIIEIDQDVASMTHICLFEIKTNLDHVAHAVSQACKSLEKYLEKKHERPATANTRWNLDI